MPIKRDVNGIIDYCLDKVEQIDERTDIDCEKKAKIGLIYLKEVRGMVMAGLAYKKLYVTSPDLAKDKTIVLTVGTGPKLTSDSA